MELIRFEELPPERHRKKNELMERLFENFGGCIYDLESKLIGEKLIATFRDKKAKKYWARVEKRVEIFSKGGKIYG